MKSALAQVDGQYLCNERPKIRVNDEEIAYASFKERDSFDKTIKCTYFIVVLFAKGNGTHSIDNVNYTIGERQLHFLFPGQHHHWETGEGTEAQQIVIGKKVFEAFSSHEIFYLMRHNLHPVFKLDGDIFGMVHQELKAIESELSSPSPDKVWKEILSVRMNIIASMIAREAETYVKETIFKNANIIVQNFWLLLNQHFAKRKKVFWYAEQLHVHPNYLSSLCKKHLNITAAQMIGQRLLLEAKKQLRHSERSIKQISFDLGFKDAASFSTYFKEKSGFSPKAYRG